MGVLFLAAVVVWGVARRAGSAGDPDALPSHPAPRSDTIVARPDRTAEAEAAPVPAPFPDRAQAVADTCGLPVQVRCAGAACAAVLTMPDMDRPTGWLALTLRSPRFVLSTAARDLGVPPVATPCGAAVERLLVDPVVALELADGSEVWCAAARADAESRALCAALATPMIGARAAAFVDEPLRELSFSPGSPHR